MGKLVRDGCDADAIVHKLANFNLKEEWERPTVLVTIVQNYLASYRDYPLIQKIMRNTILRPINRKRWIIYDAENVEEFSLDGKEHLFMLLNPDTVLSRVKTCKVVYNPTSNVILDDSGPIATYNSYRPPAWRYKHFFGQETLRQVEHPPELFMRFFRHLCANDTGSIEFLLDWLAISLQARNMTYLCTIGDEGIGKGLLGQIISRLHGAENSVTIKFDSIVKQFNALVADKTFIYLDEVNNVKSTQLDMLKRLNDSNMEVERKYQEAESNVNYSNLYLSSNHLNSLPIGPKDRRMSIIMLTETRFEQAGFTKDEISTLLTDDNMLTDLACYLFYRKYNSSNISFAYKSQRALEMLDSTILDWQRSYLDEFCKKYAGEVVKASDVVALINNFAGRTRPASTPALSALSKKMPGIFTVKKANKYKVIDNVRTAESITAAGLSNGTSDRIMCVHILPINEQKQYEVVTEE